MDNEESIKHGIKDGLFKKFFRKSEHFVHLYKECSGKQLNPEDIEPFDLSSDAVKLLNYNDVSQLTRDNRLIIMAEHLSSPLPNVCPRDLVYYVNIVQRFLAMNGKTLSSNNKVEIPLPEFYVAYNGNKPFSKKHLTFGNDFLQVKAILVDINFDNLKDQNPGNTLAGYSYFVKCLRDKKAQGAPDAIAITYAVDQCKKEKYLSGIVDKEDFIMVTQEDILRILYPTEEMVRAEAWEDGLEEGRQVGLQEGHIVSIIKQIHRKLLKSKTRAQIIEELELDEDDIKILDNFDSYKHLLPS